MSKVYANRDYGFVGWNGDTVNVTAGDEYELNDPFVQAHPDMFTGANPKPEPRPEPKRRGRRG